MKLINSIKSIGIKLWKDESGQGTAEYALILVAVVVFAGVFKSQISAKLEGLFTDLGTKISEFVN